MGEAGQHRPEFVGCGEVRAVPSVGPFHEGHCVAGVFLQQFVGTREGSDTRIPWAHIDIAGPAHNSGGGWGFTGTGATGAAVRTLVRLGEQLSAA